MPQPNHMLPAMMSAPMATGIDPTMMYGMEGMPLPFGSDPRMALAGQFLLAPRVREMMGQSGYAPFGLGHDQNVYDAYKKQQYTQVQQQVVMAAAMKDRDNMFKTFRGMSAMAGIGFGAEQRRAANSLADITSMASPIMAAMNPDLLDQMGGSRGSAAVMAKRMMDAGRYRIDPVTGRMGMSQDSTTKLVSQVYDDLYLHGDPRDMKGVTAGQAGALFGELQNRGMVFGSPGDPRSRSRVALAEMSRTDPGGLAGQSVTLPGDPTKISAADLDKLSLDESVAGRLRAFDADKIKRSLKSYAGAVTAMRDIFGDMGKPNAPMQELMGGLEALTMGSMSHMDPARAGMIARQTYNLAKQTGVTMDSAMVLQQHAGARAQQLGLEPIFAVHATQGALAFGGAYRSQGHAAHTAFGAFNADQMTQLDANLRLQAAGSNMANQLGAAMRIHETGGLKKGSDAARFATAVMSGVNEFVDSNGKVRSLNMSQSEFMAMMNAAGADDATVRDMLDQRDTNREQIDRYGITNIVRKEQAVGEMRPQVALRMGETLNQRLRGTGKLTDDQIRGVIDKVSPNAAKRVMEMSTERFSRTGDREAEIARILEDELRGTDAGAVIAGMSKEDRDRFLKTTASQFYGNVDRFIKQSGYRGISNFQNMHRAMNAGVMQEAERQQMQARFTGEMQETLSPLGRGSAMSRAIDAMQGLRDGDAEGIKRVMMKAFGGVDTREINMALQTPLHELAKKKTQVEQLEATVLRSSDSEEKTRLMSQLDSLKRELKAQTDEVAKTGEKFGLYKDAGVTKEDTDRAMKSTSAVAKSVMDLAGIRGGFGAAVTDEQARAAAAAYGKNNVTPDEAAAVIIARRQADQNWGVSEEEAKKQAEASGGRVTKEQALAAMRAKAKDRIGFITDEEIALEMQNGAIDTASEGGMRAARALALHRRRKTPLRGSLDDVKRVKEEAAKRGETLTDEQAQEMADAEQRAKRLGLTDEEIRTYETGDTAKGIAPAGSRYAAIGNAIRNRELNRFKVSDEQRRAFVEGNAQLRGKVDLGTEDGRNMVDDLILKGRAATERDRFREFRQSDDGARFREDVDMRSQDVENVMAKLLSSPQMMERFGMHALTVHDDLKAGQQRLRDLAMMHAGGDMGRLMMGDYDIDAGSREGAAKAAGLRNEVFDLVRQQTTLIRAAHGTHGAAGRQLQLGTAGEALVEGGDAVAPVRDLIRKRTLMAEGLDPNMSFEDIGKLPPDKRQQILDRFQIEASRLDVKKDLGEGDQQKLLAAQESIGNDREALGLLGVRQMPGETVKETLARIKATADDPNADRSLRAGFKYATENFDRIKTSVATARRIRPEDEARVVGFTDLLKRVDDFAAKHKTTPKDLAEMLEGKKEIAGLTKEQVAGIGKDMHALGKETPEMLAWMKERGITGGVESLRDYRNMRDSLLARQAEAQGREATGGMELLSQFQQAYGFDAIGEEQKNQFAPIATRLGGAEQRRLMQQVLGTQESLKGQAADALVTLRNRAAALGDSTPDGKEAKELIARMTDPGKKNAGIDVLAGAYRDAMGATARTDAGGKKTESDQVARDRAVAEFKTKFGMSDSAFRRFEQAYELQNKLGLTGYGHGRAHDERQLAAVIDRMQTGGVEMRAPGDKSGPTGPTHITGELLLKGNVGYLDAGTGGGMVHGGPTG